MGSPQVHERVFSSRSVRRFRSFLFARRIPMPMNGAIQREKPASVPRLRSVIRVPPYELVVVTISTGSSS